MTDTMLVDEEDPSRTGVLEPFRWARHSPGGDKIVGVAFIVDVRLERDHQLPFSDLDVLTIHTAARLAMRQAQDVPEEAVEVG